MRTFFYGLRQGLKNMVKNRLYSLAAIGTIAICLFLLGVFTLLVSNIQYMMANAESTVGVTVFFDEGITEDRIDAIKREVESYKEVGEVIYISADEAWENFKTELGGEDESIAATFGSDNPLADSASLEVHLNDVSAQENVAGMIKRIDGVRKVNSSSTVAVGLTNLNLLVTYVSVAIIILLLLVSVFLINSAVATGIRMRREEISVIKFVGATNLFVRLPFLVEGIVIGIVGAAVPLVILWALYDRLIQFILTRFSTLSAWLTFVDMGTEMRVLVPVFFVVGIGIGWLGSLISVHRYLREKKIN